MKQKGCSILFVNNRNEILLFLRDNKPDIPFPNMWDILGGHVENDETSEECIVREMKEEMNLDLQGFQLFSVVDFPDRTEYTFWKKKNLDIAQINLIEGQCLKWFTQEEVENTEVAYGFNKIIEDFFRMAPFASHN